MEQSIIIYVSLYFLRHHQEKKIFIYSCFFFSFLDQLPIFANSYKKYLLERSTLNSPAELCYQIHVTSCSLTQRACLLEIGSLLFSFLCLLWRSSPSITCNWQPAAARTLLASSNYLAGQFFHCFPILLSFLFLPPVEFYCQTSLTFHLLSLLSHCLF